MPGRASSDPSPGRFILTGSQQLGLIESVAQTLAGRTALLQLLPLNLAEIQRFPKRPADLWTLIWTSGYPRIYDRKLPAGEWLSSYCSAGHLGIECDLVIEQGDRVTAVEIKSGQTVAADVFAALARVVDDLCAGPGGTMPVAPVVVHAGSDSHARTGAYQLSWPDVDRFKLTTRPSRPSKAR